MTTAPKLVAWRLLVDAIIVVARTLLPELWARYCAIVVELEPNERKLNTESVARQRLLRSREAKSWEAEDWDGFGEILIPGYRSAATPDEVRRIRLAKESLELERQFQAALLGELQAGRWEGESISERDGRAQKIALATWYVAGLAFDVPNSAVQPGTAPRLLGVRLRPVQQEGQLPADLEARSEPIPETPTIAAPVAAPRRRARDRDIDKAITAVYDQAAKDKAKPPNINEIAKPVQTLLAKDGRQASGRKIKELAGAEKHAKRRLPVGPHFSESS